MPTGSDLMGIIPTKSAGPNPALSAFFRLNTATLPLFWRVTKANLSSGEVTTSIAPFPPGLLSDPTGVVSPDSRSLTRNTVIPLSPATSRYRWLWVNASPSGFPSGTFWTTLGTNLAVFMTTRGAPLRNDTKPKWLGVTTTSNGFPPTWTKWLRTCGSRDDGAVFVVHPGSVRTRVVPVCPAPPLPPPALRPSSRYAPPAPARTTQATTTASARRDRRRGGPAGGPSGAADGGPCGGAPAGRYRWP
jgi:hypothetical protein